MKKESSILIKDVGLLVALQKLVGAKLYIIFRCSRMNICIHLRSGRLDYWGGL